MHTENISAGTRSDVPLDTIVRELQQLRADAGNVSFGEIATLVAKRREEAGQSPAAARVARSSVHSMFTVGRRRMNPDFLAEIVFVLWERRPGSGSDAAHTATSAASQAQAFRARCIEAHRTDLSPPSENAIPVPAPVAMGSIPRSFTKLPLAGIRPFSPLITVLILVSSVGLNHYGGTLNAKFASPLYLDMIGTAIASIALGPWHGALVGLASNTLGALAANPVSIAFALVNIAGALVWGYGVRAWRMRRPLWRFLLLNVLVAIGCTLVAVPINVLLFGGVADGHAAIDAVSLLLQSGEGLWQAVFSVNIVSSLVDKQIAGCLALGAVYLLGRWRAPASP